MKKLGIVAVCAAISLGAIGVAQAQLVTSGGKLTVFNLQFLCLNCSASSVPANALHDPSGSVLHDPSGNILTGP